MFILFLAMFSLDIFDGNYGFWGTILGLFMHNIPDIILAIVLWIAWKRELVGAIAYIFAGSFYTLMVMMNGFKEGLDLSYIPIILIIAGPAFLIGIFFLWGWKRKRK